MAKADEILAKMGISDSVPLSEASTESLHSVGKKYNEDLPQIDDTQRLALLEACGAVDSDKTEINDTDDNGSDSVPEAEEEVAIKFKPARKLVKANPKAKPTKENPVVIVADNKNPKPSETKKKGRCWKGYKPTPGKKAYSDGSCIKEGAGMISIALGEMTSVGSIGVNMAGAQEDPMKPKKKKKKKSRKGNKATNKFLNNTFKELQ